ncbi:hypothetical protein BDW02DRAFT_267332 [Decorospora gaudefroyi]|uniref:RING-type domain-containing protein n=1 Tax=Decorospora gaudefroyi TaxID=184978 RepID=A0A6A5KJ56_9PLEO|nr:hypothetical protein BDW02DRAFT_267332 [Decorospora gaudefroyi]
MTANQPERDDYLQQIWSSQLCPLIDSPDPDLSNECGICMSNFNDTTTKRIRLSCGHRHYCYSCLAKWAFSGCTTCPLCRTELWRRPRLNFRPASFLSRPHSSGTSTNPYAIYSMLHQRPLPLPGQSSRAPPSERHRVDFQLRRATARATITIPTAPPEARNYQRREHITICLEFRMISSNRGYFF